MLRCVIQSNSELLTCRLHARLPPITQLPVGYPFNPKAIPGMLTCRPRARLPPITQRRDNRTPADAFLNRGFAFQAPAWQRCQLRQVLLTKVFRQSSQRFVGILNEIRHASRTTMRIRNIVHNACCKAHTPVPSASIFKSSLILAS